jgi:hypothetical protein
MLFFKKDIAVKFVDMCEKEKGKVAVHCKVYLYFKK